MNGSLTSNLLRPYVKTLVKQCSCLLHIHSYNTCWTQHRLLQLPLASLECGALLQSFTNTKFIKQGQQLHAHMISFRILENNTYLNSKLAAFYAGCGHVAQAEVIFNGILFKNSFLWNFMIRGYACNGLPMKSIIMYREMLCFGQRADNFTYPFVLKACGDLLLLEIGRRVHSEAVICGLHSDIYVCNSLLAMYAKFGDMGTARMVFDRMAERDLTSWNTIISGYAKNGDSEVAFLVFELMGKSGLLGDCTTLLGLLSACTDLKAVRQGKEIHGYAVRHSIGSCNNFLANSLIEMYCICNSMVDARRLFEKVRWKDTVSWNSMISGYARNGDAFESLRLFSQMALDGLGPDQVTFVAVLGACDQIAALRYGMSIHSYLVKKGFYASTFVGTALVDMYSKCGSLACSRRVFYEMPEKSLVSWSAMIAGYGLHGMGRGAISILNGLRANSVIPDGGVFTSILSACSHSGLVGEGKDIFYKMKREYNVKPTLSHYSCMVDLLGRAGHLDEAYEIIRTMEVKPTSDIWAALLTASRLHKNVKLAEVSAQKVFEMNPEGVSSYVCLSNIYAAEKRWEDAERIRDIARRKGLKKPPGCSFIELDNRVHQFLVGDKSHPQTDDIYAKLEELKQPLKEAGYKPDTSSVLYAVEEEAKEKMLWDHSERLAIAFALINTGPDTVIRITKNLRVCGDCHTVTKLISKLTGREIIMRDIHRFHHFTKGFCSCGDYW